MEFAQALNELLAEKGWKAADLCRITGIESGPMSRYLNGRTIPKINVVIDIADSLHMSLDELMRRKPALFAPPALSDDELTLLSHYHDCTPSAKEKVIEYAELIGDKSKESGQGSEQSMRYA